MKSKVILSFFICLSLISSKCERDDYHHNIIIKNNSSSTISVSPSFAYPDTTIICPLGFYELLPGEEQTDYQKDGWEPTLYKPQYFQIFILDTSIVNSTSCDSIKKYNKILKRYQLNIDDLNRMNWTVTYP